jgi:hypothetical protein
MSTFLIFKKIPQEMDNEKGAMGAFLKFSISIKLITLQKRESSSVDDDIYCG